MILINAWNWVTCFLFCHYMIEINEFWTKKDVSKHNTISWSSFARATTSSKFVFDSWQMWYYSLSSLIKEKAKMVTGYSSATSYGSCARIKWDPKEKFWYFSGTKVTVFQSDTLCSCFVVTNSRSYQCMQFISLVFTISLSNSLNQWPEFAAMSSSLVLFMVLIVKSCVRLVKFICPYWELVC